MNFIKFCLVAIFCSVMLFGTVFGQFENFPAFFNQVQQSQLSNTRNAAQNGREDTGPVQFPQSPASGGESSGVQVGASGFGFVPPNGARARSVPSVAAIGGNSFQGPHGGQFFQVQ